MLSYPEQHDGDGLPRRGLEDAERGEGARVLVQGAPGPAGHRDSSTGHEDLQASAPHRMRVGQGGGTVGSRRGAESVLESSRGTLGSGQEP